MRLMHLSDLHLGKIVNGFSMLEDQQYILKEILQIADEQKPDAVLLCGDIYDRPVPPEEAVRMFDEFLTSLAERDLAVFIISGNHDSSARLAFGSRLIESQRIYLAGLLDEAPQPILLEDEYGKVCFYLVPFVKPAHIRNAFANDENLPELRSYQEAYAFLMDKIQADPRERNVILAHQFVTGAVRSESEVISVGGTDNIDASLFDAFDYAALGHIHRPQSVARKTVRYSGTPLKYSFSEANHEKSVTIVDLKEKGNVALQLIPLHPLRDMREICGSYEQLTLRSNYINTNTEDYLHVTLTDEEDILDVLTKLRTIYPNIMKLDYDNLRTSHTEEISGVQALEEKTPLQLAEEFFALTNNHPVNEEQHAYLEEMLERLEAVR